MKRALLASMLTVAAAGCGAPECEQADRLDVVGQPAPHADQVLTVAQEHCGRPIVGLLVWRTDEELAGEEPVTVGGRCYWDGEGCGMRIWVRRRFSSDGTKEYVATSTSLAHELGHWCLDTRDENEADRWAAFVDYEARARIADHR